MNEMQLKDFERGLKAPNEKHKCESKEGLMDHCCLPYLEPCQSARP